MCGLVNKDNKSQPHAQTIEGRWVTWPDLVADDLSSSVGCQYMYFTGPHQVRASSDQSPALANEKRQQRDVVHFLTRQTVL